jgi:hypothetical protein
VCLQTDLRNAFNSISRQTMLEEVQANCPDLLPWELVCYGKPSHLFFEGNQISSAGGVQQGDPLGPLFFAVGLQRVLRKLPGDLMFNVWYLDDGLMVMRNSAVPAALATLWSECTAIGLTLNLQKCGFWGTRLVPSENGASLPHEIAAPQAVRDIPGKAFLPGSGIRVLGIPVEHPDSSSFRRDLLEEHCQQLEAACDLLGQLGDPQTQLLLLRHCLDAAKVNFLLRCMDTTSCQPQLARCREVLSRSLGDVLGCAAVDQRQWTQASLPLHYGGLGVKDPVEWLAQLEQLVFWATWIRRPC